MLQKPQDPNSNEFIKIAFNFGRKPCSNAAKLRVKFESNFREIIQPNKKDMQYHARFPSNIPNWLL